MGTSFKTIGNVNVLDLQNATEETIAPIQSIGNVNLVLYSRETMHLINRLKAGNINQMVEIPTGAVLLQRVGQVVASQSYFKNLPPNAVMLITGQMIIESDVQAQDIEQHLKGLIVIGQVLCPETLAGVVSAKTMAVIGQTSSYPAFANVHVGKLVLGPAYLSSLADGSDIAVLGELSVPKVVDNQVLQKKLGKVFVLEGIMCHEENAAVLRAHLEKGNGQFEIVPAGFELVEKPVTLDEDSLDSLPSDKLYCKERIIFMEDVTPAKLDEKVSQLICQDLLISSSGLKSSLARKCSLFDTKTIFYLHKLCLIEDSQTFSAERLEAYKTPVSLVVTGELRVDEAVTPALLDQQVAKVFNYGRITGNSAQLSILESKLGTNEGEFAVTGNEEKSALEEMSDSIGNANYLVL